MSLFGLFFTEMLCQLFSKFRILKIQISNTSYNCIQLSNCIFYNFHSYLSGSCAFINSTNTQTIIEHSSFFHCSSTLSGGSTFVINSYFPIIKFCCYIGCSSSWSNAFYSSSKLQEPHHFNFSSYFNCPANESLKGAWSVLFFNGNQIVNSINSSHNNLFEAWGTGIGIYNMNSSMVQFSNFAELTGSITIGSFYGINNQQVFHYCNIVNTKITNFSGSITHTIYISSFLKFDYVILVNNSHHNTFINTNLFTIQNSIISFINGSFNNILILNNVSIESNSNVFSLSFIPTSQCYLIHSFFSISKKKIPKYITFIITFIVF